jgi:hypothetical protein
VLWIMLINCLMLLFLCGSNGVIQLKGVDVISLSPDISHDLKKLCICIPFLDPSESGFLSDSTFFLLQLGPRASTSVR